MNFAFVILIANTALFLLVLAIVNNNKINPLSPVTLFNVGFFYSYFFSGFLLQYDFDNFLVYPQIWTESTYHLAVYFIPAWLGLISFNFGYLILERKRPDKYTVPACNSDLNYSKFRACLPLVLLSLSIISALVIFSSVELSLYSLLTDLDGWEMLRDQVMRNWSGANYLYLLPVYIGFFHLCVLAYLDLRLIWRVVLFFLVLITMVIIGSRALTLSWVISLIVFREQNRKNISSYLKYVILVGVATFGALFGILQKVTSDGASAQDLNFPFNLFRRLQTSYEQFENLVNIMNSDFSFDFGRSVLEDVFVTYMPRFIFPWKPDDVGYLRAQNVLFYNDFWSIDRGTTYPVGIIAELYFNFWYFGIIFGMFFLGMLLRRIERLVKVEAAYIPALCAIAGSFLAPHRYFGPIVMTIILFLTFIFFNKKLFQDYRIPKLKFSN